MPVTVYYFNFSPCARLVQQTARMLDIPDVEFVEIDLSKGDQLKTDFRKVNPKHQVPAITDNGVHMAESRDICKYLFDKYNTDPNLEHWYPKDPAKRKKVDEWMDWSRPLHLDIEMGVVLAHVASQPGSPWRSNYGSIVAVGGPAGGRKKIQDSLRAHIVEAERIVGENNKQRVEDLDLGDLATFQEVSMAMECHPGYEWSDFPNLNKLFGLMRKLEEHDAVYGGFLSFIHPILQDRAQRRRTSCGESCWECLACFRTIKRGCCGYS